MYISGNIYTSNSLLSLFSSLGKNKAPSDNLTVALLEGSRVSTDLEGDKVTISKEAQEALIGGSYETRAQLSNVYKKNYMEDVHIRIGDTLVDYAEKTSDKETRIKMYETAASEYELSAKSNTKSAELQYKTGKAYLGATQSEKAVTFLEKAVELSPAEAKYHTSLGTAYKEVGKYDEAIKRMQEKLA